MKFPEGFQWGTATAAHQVEGNNWNNDCWLMEHLPRTLFAEPSADACDHYHRYADDIALLKALGFNAYRFSVEWARIEPEPGEFSIAALDHYRRMLAACHTNQIMPMVTFHHFTSPRWIAARGGWESAETAKLFARYCERTVAHLGDLIGAACTINELNLPVMLQEWGTVPPDDVILKTHWRRSGAEAVGAKPEDFSAFPFCCRRICRDVLIDAHLRGAAALRAGRGKFAVGMTIAMSEMQAVPGGEQARDRAKHEAADLYLDAARDDDFVGVQTYTRHVFGPNGAVEPKPGAELTQMGYEFWPEALEATIRHAYARAKRPIIVTENGIGTEDDARRIAYVDVALQGIARCLQDGIDVRGYYYWSMLDNFEWLFGYRPKFGIIAVDRATQRRIIKPSAEWLGNIARANAVQR